MIPTTVQAERGAIPFELRLPAEWLKFEPYAPERPDDPGLVLCARYGSRDQRLLLEVHAQRLGREVASADWLEAWLAANGYTVDREQRTHSPAGDNADVVATRRNEQGELFTYRIASRKNGDRAYLVLGFARPTEYARAEESFGVVTSSFLPVGAPVPSAEPLTAFDFAKIAPGTMLLPHSWQRSVDASAGLFQESVDFKNIGPNGALGQLNVLVSAPSVYASHGEVAEVLTRAARGVTGPALAVPALAPVDLPNLGDARQGDVKLTVDGETVRVRILVARRSVGASWTSFLLVGRCPAPDAYLVDAMNVRAFDIATRSFAS